VIGESPREYERWTTRLCVV